MGSNIINVSTTKLTSSASRVDFDKSLFSELYKNKGYDIVHEKALQCPCKSKSSTAQSKCRNCGGTGWFFVNLNRTKAILHSANRITEYKDWSQENIGTISVSVEAEERVTFMDRITIVRDCQGKGLISMFNEVRFMSYSSSNNELFCYLTYNCLSVEYIGVFVSTDEKLINVSSQDYSVKGNILTITNQDLIDQYVSSGNELSITIRYNHSPQFNIIDLTREFMLSPVQVGNDRRKVNLPVSCIARRTHFIDGMESYSGVKLFDNSYNDNNNC